MATIRPLIAKILIQVGADEPKEIGTIEIPIHVSIPEKTSHAININAGALDPDEARADIESRRKFYGTGH